VSNDEFGKPEKNGPKGINTRSNFNLPESFPPFTGPWIDRHPAFYYNPDILRPNASCPHLAQGWVAEKKLFFIYSIY